MASGYNLNGRGKPPRLVEIFDQTVLPIYFVTFCTKDRAKVLDNEVVHNTFKEFWRKGIEKEIFVGRYVIMPDHLHLFVSGPHGMKLEQWARLFKQHVSKGIRISFQRGFFDHLIRNNESFEQKWNYVRDNPVRAGLVNLWSEWPYQGEIFSIDRD